jgi:penicillin-binding protein 1A
MEENGFITAEQADAAKKEVLKVKGSSDNTDVHAEYVAEVVRQLMFAQYGADTYTRGLNVYTTLRAPTRTVAYRALRRGIMNYERRQSLSRAGEVRQSANLMHKKPRTSSTKRCWNTRQWRRDGGCHVLEADTKKIKAMRQNGEVIEITGEGLKPAQSGLSDKAAANIRIRRGAVIRVVQTPKSSWEITQLPEVEGAFVALDPRDGAIKAMVGGFDFEKNKFNHVTQAWRQPGSSFKPFIYSAALENGVTPATVINDAPCFSTQASPADNPGNPKTMTASLKGR